MSIRTVGVIGAGTIGRGVAQSFAQAAFEVILVDVSADRLAGATAQIGRDLLVHAMLRDRRPAPDGVDALSRIRTTTDLAEVAAADFVVENVTEDWEVKRSVYAHLDAVCRPGVIFRGQYLGGTDHQGGRGHHPPGRGARPALRSRSTGCSGSASATGWDRWRPATSSGSTRS